MTFSIRRIPIVVWIVVIALAVVIEQIAIARVNAWWADEFFALWASDPARGLGELLRLRIVTDSNPPLYFSLLHAIRLVVPNDRAAVITLNAGALCGGLVFASVIAGQSRYRAWVVLSFAVFALGGPAAAYLPEARTYSLAMTASFVAVVLAMLAILDDDRPVGWKPFVIVGIIAGFSHVFAALLCCALAAALLFVSAMSKGRAAWAQTSALAAAATASTLLWMLVWSHFGPGTLGQVNWIPFTAAFVWTSAQGALDLTYGATWLAAMFVGVVAAGLAIARSRAGAGTVAIAAVLFVAVPILISVWVPIILTRYWLVGSPLFLSTLVFLICCWTTRPRANALAGAAAGLFILICVPLSFGAALRFVADKPIWRGTSIVVPRLAGCGPGSIHVLGFTPGFAIATGAPAETFVDARTLPDTSRPSATDCAILGWSEHYVLRLNPSYMTDATDADLLRLLKLDVAPNDVVIDRHTSGFVVRRRQS